MRSILIVLAILVTVGLSGCVTVEKGARRSSDSGYLEPSIPIKFSDVPVPAGFRIVSEKSFILESGGVRAGVIRYTGKADVESVIQFYKTQMPVYNWALLNVLEYGERMLNFERENESCVVTINSKGKRVDISISLAPKSPMPAPKRHVYEEEETLGNIK